MNTKSIAIFLTILLFGMTKGISQVTFETKNFELLAEDTLTGEKISQLEIKKDCIFHISKDYGSITMTTNANILNGTFKITDIEIITDNNKTYIAFFATRGQTTFSISVGGNHQFLEVYDGDGIFYRYFNYYSVDIE